jgi:hypothetical protein
MNNDDLEYIKKVRGDSKRGAILIGSIFFLIGIILTIFGRWFIAIPFFCIGAWRLSYGITYKI